MNKQALEILNRRTKGTLNVFHLMGAHNKEARRELMSAIKGGKVTLAQSGVNRIYAALATHYKPDGSCQAVKDKNMIVMIRAELGG